MAKLENFIANHKRIAAILFVTIIATSLAYTMIENLTIATLVILFIFITTFIIIMAVFHFIKKNVNEERRYINYATIVIVFVILGDLFLNLYLDTHIFNLIFDNARKAFTGDEIWAQRGQWGDMLSGHFAAIAFVALAYSIYLQRKDIEIERSYEKLKLVYQVLSELDNKTHQFDDIVATLTYDEDETNSTSQYTGIVSISNIVMNKKNVSLAPHEQETFLNKLMQFVNIYKTSRATIVGLYPAPNNEHKEIIKLNLINHTVTLNYLLTILIWHIDKSFTRTNKEKYAESKSTEVVEMIIKLLLQNKNKNEIINEILKTHLLLY